MVERKQTNRTRRNRSEHTFDWPAPLALDLDEARELETENALLRARVAELTTRLDALAAERLELEARLAAAAAAGVERRPGGRPAPDVVDDASLDQALDREDASSEAFEAFLSTPDPHLDKVRRFLLD